jgi:hypothetical protein
VPVRKREPHIYYPLLLMSGAILGVLTPVPWLWEMNKLLNNRKFYYLSWIMDAPGLKAANAPKGTLGYELAREILGRDELPFVLHLDDDAELFDYMPNTIAWPLMSERLKIIICKNLAGNEELTWISAPISYRGKLIPYYIPRFNKNMDVLDQAKTLFAGEQKDLVMKAHLSLEKVANLSFFPLPDDPITSRNIVSETLKEEIERSCLTGIAFSRVPAS